MYNGCVKSALSYGAVCWVLEKKKRKSCKPYTKMKVLHMTCGKTFEDVISYDRIREIKGWRR